MKLEVTQDEAMEVFFDRYVNRKRKALMYGFVLSLVAAILPALLLRDAYWAIAVLVPIGIIMPWLIYYLVVLVEASHYASQRLLALGESVE